MAFNPMGYQPTYQIPSDVQQQNQMMQQQGGQQQQAMSPYDLPAGGQPGMMPGIGATSAWGLNGAMAGMSPTWNAYLQSVQGMDPIDAQSTLAALKQQYLEGGGWQQDAGGMGMSPMGGMSGQGQGGGMGNQAGLLQLLMEFRGNGNGGMFPSGGSGGDSGDGGDGGDGGE
jgi:hypothetical protein